MKSLILSLTVVMLLGGTSFAQDPRLKESQARFEKIALAMDAIANFSTSLKELSQRGERGKMIIEAGKTGDRTLIPHLRVLADDKGHLGGLTSYERMPRSQPNSAAFLAHIALAKLGDSNVLPEVFAELESVDAMTQDAAVAKLGQIGGKEAYRKLFQLLDDTSSRSHPPDNPVIPIAEHAMDVLSDLFSDTPRKPNGMTNYDRADWKTWAAKNKHLID